MSAYWNKRVGGAVRAAEGDACAAARAWAIRAADFGDALDDAVANGDDPHRPRRRARSRLLRKRRSRMRRAEKALLACARSRCGGCRAAVAALFA